MDDVSTSADLRRTLFVSSKGLDEAKQLIVGYKTGQAKEMTPELWNAKKIVDSTLHPGTMAWLPMPCWNGRELTGAGC